MNKYCITCGELRVHRRTQTGSWYRWYCAKCDTEWIPEFLPWESKIQKGETNDGSGETDQDITLLHQD